MRKKGAKLTQYEVDALEELIRAGKPDWEIARETGLSKTTVTKRRLNMGITNGGGGKKLSQETIDTILAMTRDGMSALQISNELGLDAGTVRKYQKLYGLGAISSSTKTATNFPPSLLRDWGETVNKIRVACGRKPLGE